MRFRPLGVTDILDEAFRIYRARFPLFAGLALLTALPSAVLSILVINDYVPFYAGLLTTSSPATTAPTHLGLGSLLQYPLSAVMLPFFLGPQVQVAADTILGRPTGFRRAL